MFSIGGSGTQKPLINPFSISLNANIAATLYNIAVAAFLLLQRTIAHKMGKIDLRGK